MRSVRVAAFLSGAVAFSCRVAEKIAYWLLPAEPYYRWFADEVARLARKLAAPLFEPHVTIYATSRSDRDSPTAIIDAAAQDVVSIILEPVRVNHSDTFTKTLFIEFADSDALSQLSRRLAALSTERLDYELQPHASLTYQHLPTNERAALARTVAIGSETMTFDAIAAVICRERTANADDVRAWRIVERKPLRIP